MDDSMDCSAPSTSVPSDVAVVFRRVFEGFAAICALEEPVLQSKARFAALQAFADAQGLTGRAALIGIQQLAYELRGELIDTNRFAAFYRFVYFVARERGQKSLSLEVALEAWRLVLTGRFRLLDQWCSFVQAHQRHAVSEDTWRQVLDFSRSVHEDLSNYDPGGAWPVLIDEFVDAMCQRMGRPSKLPCPKCYLYVGLSAEAPSGELCASCRSEGGLRPCDSGSWSVDSEGGGAVNHVGMAATAGSKRRRRDPLEEAAEAESVNSIAQRLAAMEPPADSGTGSDTDSDGSDLAKRVRVDQSNAASMVTQSRHHNPAAVHHYRGPSRFARRATCDSKPRGLTSAWSGSQLAASLDELNVNRALYGGVGQRIDMQQCPGSVGEKVLDMDSRLVQGMGGCSMLGPLPVHPVDPRVLVHQSAEAQGTWGEVG